MTHGHIALDEARVNTPQRLITIGEEARLQYTKKSALNDASHPARIAASDAATRVSAEGLEGADDVERPERPEGAEPVTNEDIGPVGGEPNE